jgi:hypothetical protein
MTMTVPERRMIRHFSHIGLTLALTFTIPLTRNGTPRGGRDRRRPTDAATARPHEAAATRSRGCTISDVRAQPNEP